MAPVRLRFLGCGDAFSSGGRFQTCFHLDGGDEPLLIDCGATAIVALKREGIDPSSIGWVALSHLHGDHFGGLPWLILDGTFAGRTRPLVIAGPRGVEARFSQVFEALYPGSTSAERPFEVRFLELVERIPLELGSAAVTAYPVVHASGAPSYALRVQYAGRVLAYSGDTEWTESLLDAAQGSDVFVCECNSFDSETPGHLNYHTITRRRADFGTRRLVLTHMSDEMLARVDQLDVEAAYDGACIDL